MAPESEEEGLSYEDIMYSSYLNPHPLLIPTIVKTILESFSYSELKKFRLVCTSWEYEASSILKNKTQIRLSSEKQVSNYITELDDNFSCDSYEFGTEVGLSSLFMNYFFDAFGPSTRSLKFHLTQWSGPELWRILQRLPSLQELSVRIQIPREAGFLPNPSSSLPNIRILKLNFCIDKPYKPQPPPPLEVVCPTILKELLLSMPNLEEIYCPSWPTYIRPDKVVSALFYNVIFQYPEISLRKLSHIHINNAALNDSQLLELMGKNFPLRELRLELYPDSKPYCFYFLLKSLEKTLRALILIFHPDYDAEDFQDFPILRNLEYLSLHKYCGPIDVFGRYLPNLKTLLLNDSFITEASGMMEGILLLDHHAHRAQMYQVKELIIEGVTYSPYAQLSILARSFPKLKKLRVQNVDDSMLRIIFEWLLELEELEADGKFTDAGISGIPLDVVQNIFEVPDIDRVRYHPYIGRLTNLRAVSLNSYAMSYLSVLLGLNDCKKLKYKRLVSPQILPSSSS